MKPWRIQRSALVIDRPWLRVRSEHVVLPNGQELPEFYKLETNDWVAVLAVTPDAELVVVDQYRHGIAAVTRELPAGMIDDAETPAAAAQRELLEETGFAGSDLEHLITLPTEPSRHTTHAHFYICRNAQRVAPPKLDPSEDIEVGLLPREQVLPAILAGSIRHAAHVAAILLAARQGVI